MVVIVPVTVITSDDDDNDNVIVVVSSGSSKDDSNTPSNSATQWYCVHAPMKKARTSSPGPTMAISHSPIPSSTVQLPLLPDPSSPNSARLASVSPEVDRYPDIMPEVQVNLPEQNDDKDANIFANITYKVDNLPPLPPTASTMISNNSPQQTGKVGSKADVETVPIDKGSHLSRVPPGDLLAKPAVNPVVGASGQYPCVRASVQDRVYEPQTTRITAK
ncbi:hypothetical protein OF83DRAFT_1176346 [Amylostereum chailletii]|nr:hypothetical protein OF83DRAFT_1176346 [Amylostereum chailletii]